MNDFERSMALPTPCHLLPDEAMFGRPVWIKRDDLVHPVVSGNKYRKLKYPLAALIEHAQRTGGIPELITMGGIWSNHVHATAYAAAQLGIHSRALIRAHHGMHSAMLDDCLARGMHIQYVDRIAYRQLRERDNFWRSLIEGDTGKAIGVDLHWLPEGGSSPGALRGVAELIDELPFIPDVIVLACGTAATLAGVLAGLNGRSRVLGIAVLNDAYHLSDAVQRLLSQAGYPAHRNYQLLTEFHHGGYAKVTPPLRQFCSDFFNRHRIALEPVYTGKVFYALRNLIDSGAIRHDESVLVIHTGGLQGARGFDPS